MSEQELIDVFSQLYKNCCKKSVPNVEDAANLQYVDAAMNLVAHHSSTLRELVLVALTSCRQCFIQRCSYLCEHMLNANILALVVS